MSKIIVNKRNVRIKKLCGPASEFVLDQTEDEEQEQSEK